MTDYVYVRFLRGAIASFEAVTVPEVTDMVDHPSVASIPDVVQIDPLTRAAWDGFYADVGRLGAEAAKWSLFWFTMAQHKRSTHLIDEHW